MFKLKNNTNFVSNYETIRFRSASAALTDNAAKSTQIPELPGLHFSPTLDPKYFISTLFKCRNASQIKQVHAHVSTNGMLHCLTMANKLLYSYTQQKDLVNAYALFGEIKEKDPVSWSVMIGGFSKVGDFRHCFETFRELMRNGAQPDSYNLPFVIRVCRDELGVSMGRLVHCIVLKNGLHLDHFVCAALVDMYAKCGMIEEGKKVFDKMPKRDLVTWTVMISALSECGNAEESWALFDNMRAEGVFPDKIAMVTIVNACAKLGVMHKASVVHEYIVRNNFSLDVILGTAMIDMYAKCGSVDLAREIFDMMQRKNVISWSAMIAAYGYHGQGRKALDLFHMMLSNETLPNNITFVSLLYACSHAGLVEDGLQIFSLMQGSYGVVPDVKHYTCMVDLLGRAGKVNEAFGLIDNISVKKDEGLWCALLGACRIHKHVDLAEKAAQSLLDLQPQNPGYYVLLSNIYANAGKWKDVAKIRDLLTKRGLKKIPGYTWIEIDNIVHRFSVGDKTHPQSKEIYGMLKVLTEKLELAGYVPDTNFVLHDVDEEVKVGILSTHSEKLAIAFGVLATKEDTPIRITKNLRVCGDCHTFIKLVSTITQREIVVRDANRFHHFKEGACSCDDYWLQFLDPGESVIMISMVKKLQKLTSKKVQLILTDKPKFIYVDPSKLVAKGNIIWSDNSNDLSVQVTTPSHFKICTPKKVMSFEDAKQRAIQWKKAIESLQSQ